jgi:hypothetical protein
MGGQRRTQRFPVDYDINYTARSADGRIAGAGRAVNMSSGGILFTAEHTLDVGWQVELSINWPTKLDGKQPLKLVVVGNVVRSGAGETALEIHEYEFRIRAKQPIAVRPSALSDAPERLRPERATG